MIIKNKLYLFLLVLFYLASFSFFLFSNFNVLIYRILNFLNIKNQECIDYKNFAEDQLVYSQYETLDFTCLNKILFIENNVAYLGILPNNSIQILKITTAIFYILLFLYLFNYIFEIKYVKINIAKFLNRKEVFYILFFLSFVLIRYFKTVTFNTEYLNTLKLSFFSFVGINILYFVFFFIIYFLASKIKNKLIKLFFDILLIGFPLLNYFDLSEYFYVIILPILFYFFNKKEHYKQLMPILLLFFYISFSSTIFNIYHNEIDRNIFLNQDLRLRLFKSEKPENETAFKNEYINNSSSVFIFWVDELPGSIINSDSGVRNNFTNIKKFEEQSFNFIYNASSSSSSSISLNETFVNNGLLDTLSNNYRIKTFEPWTNICNFEYCKYSSNDLDDIKRINTYDILAIYLNFYNNDLIDPSVPNISSTAINFWNRNSKFATSYMDDFIIRNEISTINELLINFGQEDFLLVHSNLPHHPWRFIGNGNYYHISNTNFFVDFDISSSRYLNWDNDYSINEYYQNIEVSRLISQTELVDKLFGDYLNILKENNMYDNSIIILASDHGFNFLPENNTRLGSENNLQVYHTPLLVKLPFQNSKKIISKVSSNEIIAKIIKSEINQDNSITNINLFEPSGRVVLTKKDQFNTNNNDYYFDTEDFKIQSDLNKNIIDRGFIFLKNSNKWKEESIEDSEFEDITNNIVLEFKPNLQQKELVYYLSFKTDLFFNEIFIQYKNKLLTFRNTEELNNYVFLLEEPIEYDLVQDIKFFMKK